MRKSVLSRSVIAIASLAIGSMALVATPATAAGPVPTTRDLVLAAAQLEPSSHSNELDSLIALACDFDDTQEEGNYNDVERLSTAPFVTDNAHGILVGAYLHEETDDEIRHRWCTFAALATTDEAFALSGDAVITLMGYQEGPQLRAADPDASATSALSGNVFVTAPINKDEYYQINSASLTAAGNATRTVDATTTDKVDFTKPRTAAGEKASKAKYDKRLKAAAKWYTKKLAKAGNSKSKKAAAKKAYAKKKAAYKRAYDKRYFGTRTDSKKTPQVENRPFNVTVTTDEFHSES